MNRLETEANNGGIHTSEKIMALATICANILRSRRSHILQTSVQVGGGLPSIHPFNLEAMFDSLANFDIAYQEARESAYGATNEDIAYWTLRYASCYRSVIRLLR